MEMKTWCYLRKWHESLVGGRHWLLVLEKVGWKSKCVEQTKGKWLLSAHYCRLRLLLVNEIQWQEEVAHYILDHITVQRPVLPAPFLLSIYSCSSCPMRQAFRSAKQNEMQIHDTEYGKYETFFISAFIIYGTTLVYCLYSTPSIIIFLSADLFCAQGPTKR